MYQYIGSHPSPRRPLQCCKARGGFDTSPGPYILNEMGAYIYMHAAPKYTPHPSIYHSYSSLVSSTLNKCSAISWTGWHYSFDSAVRRHPRIQPCNMQPNPEQANGPGVPHLRYLLGPWDRSFIQQATPKSAILSGASGESSISNRFSGLMSLLEGQFNKCVIWVFRSVV